MPQLRFPCLVLDHDDTVVDSTAHIHYPAFLSGVELLRPGQVSMTLEDYFRMNYDPGLVSYYREVLHFTDQEIDWESRHWLDYVETHIPTAYDGMARLIARQKELGGLVCVVSHSQRQNILRDYRANSLAEPDLIYGSELPWDRCKPNPWPLLDMMERLGLEPGQLLVVDDLPLGLQMSKAAQVPFVAAGWAHAIPQIRAFMDAQGVPTFSSPAQLYDYLFV